MLSCPTHGEPGRHATVVRLVYNIFRRWAKAGVWRRVHDALRDLASQTVRGPDGARRRDRALGQRGLRHRQVVTAANIPGP
jgi:transposase